MCFVSSKGLVTYEALEIFLVLVYFFVSLQIVPASEQFSATSTLMTVVIVARNGPNQ